MLIYVLRFLRGTVEFLISGPFPEKLLNKCTPARIPIWGLKPQNDGFFASSYAGSYKSVSRIARKNGMRTRITKKSGLPFYRIRYRKRWGFVIGAILSCVMLWYLFSRIWVVTIEGCSAVPESELRTALAQLGLQSGVQKSKTDPKRIEQEMLLKDDRLSWITVNLSGVFADVVIGERVAPPKVIDPDDRYANVVAACDGKICKIELYDGQPIVKVGDTVSKGQILISGITDDQYGNTMLRFARAKVTARVYEEFSITVPFTERVFREGSEPRIERELIIFGSCFPREKSLDFKNAVRVESRSTEILFPFLTVRENYCFPAVIEEVNYNEFEAKEEAMRRLKAEQKAAQDAYGDSRIINEETETLITDESLTIKSIVYMEKDIAETLEFSAF